MIIRYLEKYIFSGTTCVPDAKALPTHIINGTVDVDAVLMNDGVSLNSFCKILIKLMALIYRTFCLVR